MLLPFHLAPPPLWKALYHCDSSFQVDTVLPERDARTSQEMLGHLHSLSDVEGCLYQGREPLLVTQSWTPSLWASHQRNQVLPYKDLKYEFHLCLPAAHCQPEPKQPEVVSHWSLLLTSCGSPLQKHISRETAPCGTESTREGSRLGHLGREFPSWLCCCLAVPLLLIDNSLFQIRFKVALYYRENAELNYKQGRKKTGK